MYDEIKISLHWPNIDTEVYDTVPVENYSSRIDIIININFISSPFHHRVHLNVFKSTFLGSSQRRNEIPSSSFNQGSLQKYEANDSDLEDISTSLCKLFSINASYFTVFIRRCWVVTELKFVCKFCAALWAFHEKKLKRTTDYHSQKNGQKERENEKIVDRLRHYDK